MTAIERRCRRLLRAWPWRDRVERGDELLGTMLDCVGEDRSWPTVSLVLDMVLGGLSARRRRRPPFATRMRYRLGGRLDYQWHQWMVDNLLSPGWRFRLASSQTGLLVVMLFAPYALLPYMDLTPGLALWLAFCCFVNVAIRFLTAGRARKSALRRYGYSLDGSTQQVVSDFVWVQRSEQFPNVRMTLVSAGSSPPLIGLGLWGLVTWPSKSTEFGFDDFHVPIFLLTVGALIFLAAGWARARGVPVGTDEVCVEASPWVPRIAALITAVVALFVGTSLPHPPLGVAGGVVGLGFAGLGLALRWHERRIGRRIGLWDVIPSAAPRAALVPRDIGRWYPQIPLADDVNNRARE